MINNVRKLFSHMIFKQTVVLYFGFLFFGGAVFIGNTLIARILTPDAFGTYQLVVGIIMFSAFFFDFGLSATGARILSISKNVQEERRDFSNLFFMFLCVCLVYLFVLIVGQFIVESVYGIGVSEIFSIVIFSAFLYPFYHFFPSTFQGMNHMGKSAIYYFLQGILFLVLVLFGLEYLSPLNASLMFYGSFFAATLIMSVTCMPSPLHLATQRIKRILSENKRYGIHIYLGNTVERTSFHLDKLMIAFFASTEQVAHYSLGLMLIALMTTFSMAFNQSLFKRFAVSRVIDKKVFFYNGLWTFCSSVALLLLQKPIISLAFGQQYLPVADIMIPLVMAGACQALYQPYQAYLASNGIKEISRGSYIAAAVNVVFNIVLIPIYGYIGAAISTLLCYLAWYIFLRRLYLKTISG